MAMRHGTATAPPFVGILEAAQMYHVEPSAYAGDGEKLLWFIRTQVQQHLRARVRREKDNNF